MDGELMVDGESGPRQDVVENDESKGRRDDGQRCNVRGKRIKQAYALQAHGKRENKGEERTMRRETRMW